MYEEYSFQRSGKKCREKFENLYKYYKKTKESKAGRHNGKNYRFFRQLEAIYGESSAVAHQDGGSRHNRSPLGLVNVYGARAFNVESENRSGRAEPPRCCQNFANSMSVEYLGLDISSEEEDDGGGGEGELSVIAVAMAEEKTRRSAGSEGQASKMSASSGSGDIRRKGWKEKVKKIVDGQVARILEKQQDWMERMMSVMESNERDRVRREMEWREREAARFERERELWVKERAWMEARDVNFLDAMRKFTGRDPSGNREQYDAKDAEENLDCANLNNEITSTTRWRKPEILSFIQVVTSMEQRGQPCATESGRNGEGFWASIEAKMGSLGYYRSAAECRDEWDNISDAFRKI